MKRYLVLLSLLSAALTSHADGYEVWDFGMTRDEVSRQAQYGPYYSFKNGDLGSEAGPYESEKAKISFYFDADRLTRIMIIAYMGDSLILARTAWSKAYQHLHRIAGQVEVPDMGTGAAGLEVALASFDRSAPSLAAGKRIHMGAFPMPTERRVWATVTRLENQQIMISINYGAP